MTFRRAAAAEVGPIQHGFPQNLVLRPKRLHLSVGQDHQKIESRQRRWPVRNHHNDGATRANRGNRLGERRVALRIEVGVWLVENDQKWIAIERARQCHALALARRQRRASLADLGLVALGQPQDHAVHAGLGGGCDDRVAFGVGIEARDILGDGAVEQLDILRQVAQMASERIGRPLVERSTIEPNRAPLRQPGADQRPRQGRLAGG